MGDVDGWSGMGWRSWRDPDEVRARLASGADPHSGPDGRPPPLHHAAQYGSAEVVAELAAAVTDVDAVRDGRTALWVAVNAGEDDNARALAAAGADPWRPMMNGWSPGRLSLAGPTPGLFAPPPRLFAPPPGLFAPPPGLFAPTPGLSRRLALSRRARPGSRRLRLPLSPRRTGSSPRSGICMTKA